MNILNKDEIKFCKDNIKIIEQIVVTSSCSFVPPVYINKLKDINFERKYTTCITCNSSIFLATNKLYKDYIFTIKNQKKEKEVKQQ